MKRLSEQTNIEKAKNLHELLPDEIPVVLLFIAEKIKIIKEKPEKLTELLATDITPEKWLELLELIAETIDKDYKRLESDSDFFSRQLFEGYAGVFVIHCLQDYMNVCNNNQFFKAVELLFDV